MTSRRVRKFLCVLATFMVFLLVPASAAQAIVCTPNEHYCAGNILKTCNAAGNGEVPGSDVDCSSSPNGICQTSGGTSQCVTQGTGDPNASIIDLDAIMNSMVGDLGFKFGPGTTIGSIITAILPYLYAVAGFGLLIFLIGGGFAYLTSAGDPKRMEAAKNTITLAVIGFIIIIAAFWVTQIVNYVFGLKAPF